MGRRADTPRFDGSAQESAPALTAVLEGAMPLARAHGDPQHFDAAASYLTRELTGPA